MEQNIYLTIYRKWLICCVWPSLNSYLNIIPRIEYMSTTSTTPSSNSNTKNKKFEKHKNDNDSSETCYSNTMHQSWIWSWTQKSMIEANENIANRHFSLSFIHTYRLIHIEWRNNPFILAINHTIFPGPFAILYVVRTIRRTTQQPNEFKTIFTEFPYFLLFYSRVSDLGWILSLILCGLCVCVFFLSSCPIFCLFCYLFSMYEFGFSS